MLGTEPVHVESNSQATVKMFTPLTGGGLKITARMHIKLGTACTVITTKMLKHKIENYRSNSTWKINFPTKKSGVRHLS